MSNDDDQASSDIDESMKEEIEDIEEDEEDQEAIVISEPKKRNIDLSSDKKPIPAMGLGLGLGIGGGLGGKKMGGFALDLSKAKRTCDDEEN
jgi:hypothetical protein